MGFYHLLFSDKVLTCAANSKTKVKILILKELRDGEARVAITPQVAQNLIKEGHELTIQSNAGLGSAFSNEQYQLFGVQVCSTEEIPLQTELIVGVNPPTINQVNLMPASCAIMSFVYPTLKPTLLESLKAKNIKVIAMEAVPRISRAQNMDALSSQANLAGYKAVITGAQHLTRIFPLMMTAAGTITPAKVLIFGAGVAGLQAVATAKRLGAVVEVTDVRPETKEQVESLGGKFISVDGPGVQISGGYASAVSEEYLQKQKAAVEKSLFHADLVITTALVMGRQAPKLITDAQLAKMKLGAVIVDMAVEQGGNCEHSIAGQITKVYGVSIVGAANLPSSLATNASELYAKNIYNLFKHLNHVDGFLHQSDDEIVAGCWISNH